MTNYFPVAVIAGTGLANAFTSIPGTRSEELVVTKNDFGGPIIYHEITGCLKFILIERHNVTGEYLCPHQINYASYMRLLYEKGVRYIFATSAVGGLNRPMFPEQLQVGSLVVPVDFIDKTGRPATFSGAGYRHSTAYYRSARQLFCLEMAKLYPDSEVIRGGVYTNITGPRYETPAELVNFCLDPAVRVLGMTAAYEAALAREISAHYSLTTIIADLPLEEPSVQGVAVEKAIAQAKDKVVRLIFSAISRLSQVNIQDWPCDCAKQPSVFEMLRQ